MAQDGPKMVPRWSQHGPKWPKMVPRWPQDGPRIGPRAPRCTQERQHDLPRAKKCEFTKTLKNFEFFKVFGVQGRPKQPWNRQGDREEAPKELQNL